MTFLLPLISSPFLSYCPFISCCFIVLLFHQNIWKVLEDPRGICHLVNTFLSKIMCLLFSLPSPPFLIFSGGMPRASYGDRHCISVIHSKTHEALDFTSRIIDFFVIRDGENHRGRDTERLIGLFLS